MALAVRQVGLAVIAAITTRGSARREMCGSCKGSAAPTLLPSSPRLPCNLWARPGLFIPITLMSSMTDYQIKACSLISFKVIPQNIFPPQCPALPVLPQGSAQTQPPALSGTQREQCYKPLYRAKWGKSHCGNCVKIHLHHQALCCAPCHPLQSFTWPPVFASSAGTAYSFGFISGIGGCSRCLIPSVINMINHNN